MPRTTQTARKSTSGKAQRRLRLKLGIDTDRAQDVPEQVEITRREAAVATETYVQRQRTRQTARKSTIGRLIPRRAPRRYRFEIEVDNAEENGSRFRRSSQREAARNITGGSSPSSSSSGIEDDISQEEVELARTVVNEAAAVEAEQPKLSDLEAKEEIKQ